MWRRDLERHLVTHKKAGEVPMFKCQLCIFSTKHQRSLSSHMQKVHVGEEISNETYKCANCDYTAKHKRNLIPHMLMHR